MLPGLTTMWMCVLAGVPGLEPSPRFPRGLTSMQLPAPPEPLGNWSNARCAQCHAPQHQAWQQGPHGQSVTSVVFQAAIQREQRGWCMRCHAPTAVGTSDATQTAVGCAACHATAQGVAATKNSDEEHRSVATPWLTDPLLCAQCHQFGFPVRNASNQVEHLSVTTQQQDTYREFLAWQAATGATQTCAPCHMPKGDHAVGGVRRLDALRAAVTVMLAPDGRVMRLSTRALGHRMPTGDIMRWLSLEVASDETFEDAQTIASFERKLDVRTFTPGAPAHLGVVDNTALPASGMGTVDVVVPVALANQKAPRVWRLSYHLISRKQELDGMLPVGLSRITIHAGNLGADP